MRFTIIEKKPEAFYVYYKDKCINPTGELTSLIYPLSKLERDALIRDFKELRPDRYDEKQGVKIKVIDKYDRLSHPNTLRYEIRRVSYIYVKKIFWWKCIGKSSDDAKVQQIIDEYFEYPKEYEIERE